MPTASSVLPHLTLPPLCDQVNCYSSMIVNQVQSQITNYPQGHTICEQPSRAHIQVGLTQSSCFFCFVVWTRFSVPFHSSNGSYMSCVTPMASAFKEKVVGTRWWGTRKCQTKGWLMPKRIGEIICAGRGELEGGDGATGRRCPS